MSKETSARGRFERIIREHVEELKKDIVFFCRAALDFYEMGANDVAKALAEQALELAEACRKTLMVLGDDEREVSGALAIARAVERIATV